VKSLVTGGYRVVYASVSDGELGQYAALFETGPGKWLLQATGAALRQALDDALRRYGETMARELGIPVERDARPDRPRRTTPVPEGLIQALTPRDGGKVLVALFSGWTLVLEVATGLERITSLADCPREDTSPYALSADGRLAAAFHQPSRGPRRILLWDADTGRSLATFAGPPGSAWAMAFTPDGKELVTGGETIELFDLGSRRLVRQLRGAGGRVRVLAVSPDGRLLAAGGDYGHLEVRAMDTGAAIWQNPQTGGFPSFDGLVFSPDGHRLAACGANETPVVWTVGAWGEARPWASDPIERMRVKLRDACRVAFSPDGRNLVEVGRAVPGGYVRMWDAGAGSILYEHLEADGPSFGLAFGPTGKKFATGNIADVVRVRDSSTGKIVKEFPLR
jgi:WD40 repeat protein